MITPSTTRRLSSLAVHCLAGCVRTESLLNSRGAVPARVRCWSAHLLGPVAAMVRAGATRAQVVLMGVSPALDAALGEAFEGDEGPRLVRSEA